MVKDLIQAAQGITEPDLILKGGYVYNSFSGDTEVTDIAIKNGIICGVGNYSGNNELDITGKYVLPGFVDSHMHIESSMVTPKEYAKVALSHGVTTVIADPHEIANVCGEAGIRFMMEDAKSVPLDIKFMLPSCVPCAPFDHAGAVLTANDTLRMAPEFFGIAEMMNYPGVLACDDEVLKKLVPGKIVDGHAPALSGNALNAYLSAGIKTDHECATSDELLEKVKKGMYIMLREGTLSKDLERLCQKINSRIARRCLFCTDDRFVGEIIQDGSIDYSILKAASNGISAPDAINMATLNAGECYNLKLGAIAPSYPADLVICDELLPRNIRMVYKNGVLVAKDYKPLFDTKSHNADSNVLNTVHLDKVDEDFFNHSLSPNSPVIELIKDSIITKKVPQTPNDKLSKVCVIERHKRTGNKGFAYVTNYGIENAAIASSIGHDSHNVIVIGDNDKDMALAVNTLGKTGGFSVCKNGEVLAFLPLEIAGLMSDKSAKDVVDAHEKLHRAAKEVGVTDGVDPFLSLAFLPLPVIPQIRVTDSGLFDVTEFKFI